jgi:hypothetical protein
MIFNRPDTTRLVFEELRKARPPKILVIADGPRQKVSSDAERCAASRAVIERIDWPCEVLKNYSDVNLGCRNRISSGLDWAFYLVPEAIILEDDCLPEPTFFRFCQELLELYRDDERIMMISGDNFQNGCRRTDDSYYFSLHAHVWGWASWRRAWKRYDVDMRDWQEIRRGGWLRDILDDESSVRYWRRIFDRVASGNINTWDYQWMFACWLQGALVILPGVNLISNIGFRPDATHPTADEGLSALATESISFPLKHPRFVIRDKAADRYTHKSHLSGGILSRLRAVLLSIRHAASTADSASIRKKST